MKIAVCFSGHFRAPYASSVNLKRYFGELLPDIDVFVHTWDTDGYRPWLDEKQHLGQNIVIQETITDKHLEYLSKIYNIKSYEIEKELAGGLKHGISPLYYSFYKSIRLMTDYEIATGIDYDVCIRLRLDTIFPPARRLNTEIVNFIEDKNSFYSDNCEVVDNEVIRIDELYWIASPKIMSRASLFFYDNTLLDMRFFEYLKHSRVNIKNMKARGYTIYRPETYGYHPVEEYDTCFDIDALYYKP